LAAPNRIRLLVFRLRPVDELELPVFHAPRVRQLCFFCKPFGDPRDLHSFPTRRSSDLGFFHGHRGRDRCIHVLSDGNGLFFVWLDRKSTRLNSSHGSISYAVSCLKKNNPARSPDSSFIPP